MTEKEYNLAEGIRRTDLWRMHDSPEKYKYFLDNPQEETSPALTFGSAAHKMILEPDTFFDEYAVAPACDRRTKEGKAMYEQFLEQSEGKTIISAEDLKTIQEMSDALHKCTLAHSLLTEDGETEVPLFWTDPETGEKCKAKLDRLIKCLDGRIAVVDYKTALNADTDKFIRKMFDLGYTLQSAHYTEAVMHNYDIDYRPLFLFVVQEKKPPYSVNVIEVTPDVMQYGVNVYHDLLGKLHECKEVDLWPGYCDDVPNEAYIPGYINFEGEEE